MTGFAEAVFHVLPAVEKRDGPSPEERHLVRVCGALH